MSQIKNMSVTPSSDPLLSRFAGLGSSMVFDAMHTLGLANGVMDSRVRHLSGAPVVGRARTVGRSTAAGNARQPHFDPSLSMGIQQVIDSIRPDDILVIEMGGDASGATWGANMATRASLLGALAVVTDGAVRDIAEMPDMGISVYAQGVSPRVNFQHIVTLSINEPVMCAGVVVVPGDIIIADHDGVIVVPAAQAEVVADKAQELHHIEQRMQEAIRGGSGLVDAIKTYKIR
jgi:4-hydroxy-4-methyl-2-oxoglutarate aldolase